LCDKNNEKAMLLQTEINKNFKMILVIEYIVDTI